VIRTIWVVQGRKAKSCKNEGCGNPAHSIKFFARKDKPPCFDLNFFLKQLLNFLQKCKRGAQAQPSWDMVSRICLNFQSRCNLNCSYCYIPFGGEEVRYDVVARVIEAAAALGFRVITLGGGDPFLYKFIGDVIHRCASVGLAVHVDTNTLGHFRRLIRTVAEKITLLGISIDGPNATAHDTMRDKKGNFETVLSNFYLAKQLGLRVKINTVVTKRNVVSLNDMVKFVRELHPFAWSVYQYWPLVQDERNQALHNIENHIFEDKKRLIQAAQLPLSVEVASVKDRLGTNLFVSHTGDIYVHDFSKMHSYSLVGSIFDSDDSSIIDGARVFSEVRSAALFRYQN
jgi:MoaA/NifB/PqqE/SkfB family radical SAM enzyme